MESKIVVVGIGPGHPDYVLPIAVQAIGSAEVLVGSRRALETFAQPSQIQVEISGKLEAVIEEIKTYRGMKKIVVMVSGDPGFYSLVPYLQKHFPIATMEIIPGLSSMQVAFCRANTVWQDALMLSLHGRGFETVIANLQIPKKLGFLTDPQHTPAVIARQLLSLGWPNCPVVLCEKLSYHDEQVVHTDLLAAATQSGFAHSVMVVIGNAE